MGRLGKVMAMDPRNPILLVTNDARTARSVATALESNGHSASDEICRDLGELAGRLERAPGSGVLVDIDPEPSRILAKLDPIIDRFGDARFIVLSSAYRNDLVLESMQIGARHFLLKQSIIPDLTGALERLLPGRTTSTPERGAMISVLGASGGCGATTVSINLAHELLLETSESVFLIDLDYCYGAVATCLGLEGRYGIDDLLSQGERVDAQLINSTGLACSEGIRALISPASTRTTEPAPLDVKPLARVLEHCKHLGSYTVVDAARVTPNVAASLAHASTLALVIFQLNVKDIRTARNLLSDLGERGVPTDRLMPIANRYRKRYSMVSLKDAQAALGAIPLTTVHNDFRSVSRCVNFGQPLAQIAPRSTLRRDLRRIATRVIEAKSRRHGVGT